MLLLQCSKQLHDRVLSACRLYDACSEQPGRQLLAKVPGVPKWAQTRHCCDAEAELILEQHAACVTVADAALFKAVA